MNYLFKAYLKNRKIRDKEDIEFLFYFFLKKIFCK